MRVGGGGSVGLGLCGGSERTRDGVDVLGDSEDFGFGVEDG